MSLARYGLTILRAERAKLEQRARRGRLSIHDAAELRNVRQAIDDLELLARLAAEEERDHRTRRPLGVSADARVGSSSSHADPCDDTAGRTGWRSEPIPPV